MLKPLSKHRKKKMVSTVRTMKNIIAKVWKVVKEWTVTNDLISNKMLDKIPKKIN